MSIFNFFKKSKDNSEVEYLSIKLIKFLKREDVKEALITMQVEGRLGLDQMTLIHDLNSILLKLSDLTGLSPEEILSNPKNLKAKSKIAQPSLSDLDILRLDNLIEWANEYNLPELKVEDHMMISGGYHEGFPRDRNKLIHLHTLNLPNCEITDLPPEISVLRNLKKIWLDQNSLKFLPDEICFLDGLEELYVPNNHITKLPDNLGLLKNLKEINFKSNNIKILPFSLVLIKTLNKADFRTQQHGCKLSSPDLASTILGNLLDDDLTFREEMHMLDDMKWEKLKQDFRNVYQKDIKIDIGGTMVPYLEHISELFGNDIANAQQSNNFYQIAKF